MLKRHRGYGIQREAGCRFVERLGSVVQTLRKRGADVLGYLTEALEAHRRGLPAPSVFSPG